MNERDRTTASPLSTMFAVIAVGGWLVVGYLLAVEAANLGDTDNEHSAWAVARAVVAVPVVASIAWYAVRRRR